jgi:trk system potassium uptake protein
VQLGAIGFVLGSVMLVMAGFMLIPAALGAATPTRDWEPFLTGAAVAAALGLGLLAVTRRTQLSIHAREAFLITTLAWLAGAGIGALPIMLHEHAGITDAFFESMSGLTTTGSTVFTGLDQMSPAFLLWRSMLQWIGGLGFTLMAIAILPLVGVGGMRLFRSESSDWSEKALPHTRDIAKTVAAIYFSLSTLCMLSYWAAGMPWFDAINHAMTTISTGGFSTSDASMGKFAAPAILWLSVIFMISGSLPFMVYYHALRQGPLALVQDEQIRTFLWMLLAVVSLSTLVLVVTTEVQPGAALTAVAFNVVSVVTTTGYASTDYLLWGPFFVGLFYFLMFTGGCSGSTAGSVKVFRLQIAFRFLSVQIRRLIHPRGVFRAKLNGRRLDDDILGAFVAFAFAMGLSIVAVAMGLAMMGLDLVTALSAATTAVTNVGPGIGNIVGPSGNFSTLPDGAKWLLALAMLLGRLELMTVLVLFAPAYWRA